MKQNKFYPINDFEFTKKYQFLRRAFSFNTKVVGFIGTRGKGKTFNNKHFLFKRFFRKGEIFAYLRDNENAIKQLVDNNGLNIYKDTKRYDTTLKKYFHDCNIKMSGNTLFINDKISGYIYANSTFYNLKGNAYDDVKYILYDEWIKEKEQAQRGNRARAFLNMIETIFRLRQDVRVLMTANALDRGDEILDMLGIQINQGFGYYVNWNKSVCIAYLPDSKEFIESKNKSVSGILAKGSAFDENMNQGLFANTKAQLFDVLPKGLALIGIFKNEDGQRIRLALKDNYLYCYWDNSTTNNDKRMVTDIKLVDTIYSLATNDLIKGVKAWHGSKQILFESDRALSVFLSIFK